MIKELRNYRAHHVVSDLYLDYIRTGELPRAFRIEKGDFPIIYPIFVTSTNDDGCELCEFQYPVINFCKGPVTRKFDRKAARILGIEIGKSYSEQELINIFAKKAKEQNLEIGKNYGWYEFEKIFYGNRKKRPLPAK